MPVAHSNIFVPLEIVREIVENVYASAVPPTISSFSDLAEVEASTKPDWHVLASLSVASRAYRAIVLEAWFRSLAIRYIHDLEDGSNLFPGILGKWTRFLRFSWLQPLDGSWKTLDLKPLTSLQVMRMDRAPNMVHYVNPPAQLQEIHINVVDQPHPFMLSQIRPFSNLRILKLHQTNTWCDLCHLGCTMYLARPSPKSIVYENGAGLPIHYMEKLSPLEALEFVSVTITTYEGMVRLDDPEDPNPFAWSGECDDCISTVLASSEFRTRWVALKTGQRLEIEGAGGRKHRFHRIPNLKRVEWHFVEGVELVECEYEDEDGEGEAEEVEA